MTSSSASRKRNTPPTYSALFSSSTFMKNVQSFSCLSLPSTNQNRKRLTGQVVGQDGEPLIGVNVVVKGTTIGSMTDMDGNYILENVPSNATVEFSYIGYLQQSINVGNKSNLNVTLAEDIIVDSFAEI